MSGHNKWSQIKRKKEATDKEKSKNFARVGKEIRLAVSSGGDDPESNSLLRVALQRAKEINMPKTSIERAIARGSGKDGANIKEAMYEAYGPGGVALLIQTQTDNTNRTVAEIKHIVEEQGGRMAGAGSVVWLFSEKGFIRVPFDKESSQFEELLIDEDVDDYSFSQGGYLIFCKPQNMMKILGTLRSQSFTPDESDVRYVANNPILLSEANRGSLERLVGALEEHDDVEDVFVNTKA